MSTRAWRYWIVLLCLITGVVFNVLVAWGIVWRGLPDERTRLMYFKLGENVVEVTECRNAMSRVLHWQVVDEQEAAIIQYLEEIESREGSTPRMPLPEGGSLALKYTPLEEATRWASFWDVPNHPPLAGNHPKAASWRCDIGAGWPMESMSMHGSPGVFVRGGLRLERDTLGKVMGALPCTPRMPGFVVNSLMWAVVVGVGIAGSRAGIRRMVQRGRARAAKCDSCGYDRRGIAATAVCPECGGAWRQSHVESAEKRTSI